MAASSSQSSASVLPHSNEFEMIDRKGPRVSIGEAPKDEDPVREIGDSDESLPDLTKSTHHDQYQMDRMGM